MEDAAVDGLSDRGSTPLRSIVKKFLVQGRIIMITHYNSSLYYYNRVYSLRKYIAEKTEKMREYRVVRRYLLWHKV